jgi:hypothetical protein
MLRAERTFMEQHHAFFGATLRSLLIEKGVTTPMGNPDWAGFSQLLDGVHYETLRKAVTGDRAPAKKLIEAVSDALVVPPETFVEYRMMEVQRHFDPKEVGAETALANLARWLELGKPGRTSDSS